MRTGIIPRLLTRVIGGRPSFFLKKKKILFKVYIQPFGYDGLALDQTCTVAPLRPLYYPLAFDRLCVLVCSISLTLLLSFIFPLGNSTLLIPRASFWLQALSLTDGMVDSRNSS